MVARRSTVHGVAGNRSQRSSPAVGLPRLTAFGEILAGDRADIRPVLMQPSVPSGLSSGRHRGIASAGNGPGSSRTMRLIISTKSRQRQVRPCRSSQSVCNQARAPPWRAAFARYERRPVAQSAVPVLRRDRARVRQGLGGDSLQNIGRIASPAKGVPRRAPAGRLFPSGGAPPIVRPPPRRDGSSSSLVSAYFRTRRNSGRTPAPASIHLKQAASDRRAFPVAVSARTSMPPSLCRIATRPVDPHCTD